MKIAVLGAGVVGVTAAWYLTKAGHEVRVIDRQDAAGMETSFANGGQVSVSHAEPWATPHAPAKVAKWLMKEDAPLLFRLRADPAQWRWGLAFLRECTPERTRQNTAQLVRLGLHSLALLRALREETGIAYHGLQRGILHFYTDAREFDAARQAEAGLRELGVSQRELTAAECVAMEPALASIGPDLAGGLHADADESGDAHVFTQELAKLCQARGASFSFGTRVERLIGAGDAIEGVKTVRADGTPELVRADAYVLSLGSYSLFLAKPLGIDLAIYPAKGYSVTLPVKDPAATPVTSLSDDEYKLVFSRLGDRLRIAGTAELTGYDTSINPVRCKAILDRTLRLFPGAGDASRASFWAGLRPATPGNQPYIGRTKYRNLFLNTGHGTLGWTHACGSGQLLAETVDGGRPALDFGLLRPPTAAP